MQRSDALVSWGIASILFGILFGATGFWNISNGAIVSLKHAAVLGGLLLLAGTASCTYERRVPQLSPVPFLTLSIIWFFSDAITRPWGWFYGVHQRGEILSCALLGVLLLRKMPRALPGIVAISAVLGIIASLLIYLDGRLLISDDHASFFYRLQLLSEQFPSIPFYNTDWNGGYDARDFFATGALGPFILYRIVSLFAIPTQAYNITAALLTIALPAFGLGVAAFIFTRKSQIAWWACVLATGSGLIWYRWGLGYGTLGFVTSTSLLPLAIALLWRAINLREITGDPTRRLSLIEFGLLVIGWTVFLLWPGSAFMLPPVALFVLISGPKIVENRRLIIAGILIAALNIPWMLLFAKVSQVGSFVTVSQEESKQTATEQEKAQSNQKRDALGKRGKAGELSTDQSLKNAREQVGSTNPLIVLLVIPGIFLLPRGSRLLIGGTIAYLVVAGTILAPLKPHLELERLALVAVMLGCIPAARAFYDGTGIFSEQRHGWALNAIPVGLMLLSPFIAASVTTNRTMMQFSVADDTWTGIEQVLREHREQNQNNGRVLFAGFLLHELDGGHAAPLPIITGVQAIASSQFHNLWTYRQVFPKSFIERGDTGIDEYLRLMNVTTILAHERQWRDYFSRRTDRFALLKSVGRFNVYSVNVTKPSFIESGEATDLSIKRNEILLTPHTDQLSLRFVYLPFLTTSGCQISAETVAPELSLIKLSRCPLGKPISIRSVNAWDRFWSH